MLSNESELNPDIEALKRENENLKLRLQIIQTHIEIN